MTSKSSTQQDGQATTEDVPGSIVTFNTEEEINTFKDDMASENTKRSTPHANVVLRKVRNRAELEVIYQKRVRGFHQGFQTPRNR